MRVVEAEVESQSSPEASVADAVIEVKAVPIQIPQCDGINCSRGESECP
jgi:hypothetical protein